LPFNALRSLRNVRRTRRDRDQTITNAPLRLNR
jgi:hypothetical protein